MTFNPALAFVTCPRGCQCATPPEPLPKSRWVCSACGHEFHFQARPDRVSHEGAKGGRRGVPVAGRAVSPMLRAVNG